MPRRLPAFRKSLVLGSHSAQVAEHQSSAWRKLPVLMDASIPTFQTRAFQPQEPFLLPRKTFTKLPAIQKWFEKSPDSDGVTLRESLKEFGDAMLPVEYSTRKSNGEIQFQRGNAPFALFLSWAMHATSSERAAAAITQQLYIAQAPLSLLPVNMYNDVATPQIVQKAGKGDIYQSSLWLGVAPTYTPLHRDPNPNLFVQLAGQKKIKIARPDKGNAMFEHIKQRLLQDGQATSGSAAVRGEEMMQGPESLMLEQEVWDSTGREEEEGLWEAEVDPGDGLFIPTGFWHSMKGIGQGINGSVNWWFR